MIRPAKERFINMNLRLIYLTKDVNNHNGIINYSSKQGFILIQPNFFLIERVEHIESFVDIRMIFVDTRVFCNI